MKGLPFIFIIFCLLSACKDDDIPESDPCVSLSDIVYAPTIKEITLPNRYQPIQQPLDNEMTDEGVLLGRHLFFDPILSADSTMSCGSCHAVGGNFTDNKATSTGIDGINGKRSAMPLVDLIYVEKGLFWDGRVSTLEDQALLPIEDPIELHDTWENVEAKLQRSEMYPAMFRKAFGINENCDISKDLASKAIAQFERSLITMGNSKFDRVLNGGDTFFTESEYRGSLFFFDRDDDGTFVPDAQCAHCHGGPLFTDNTFRNNGLTFFTDETAMNISDRGRFDVSNDPDHIGHFRVPTLRNIEFSAPYMHDGRFNTLEEVMDHYICGIQQSPTLDVLIINHCDPEDPVEFLNEQAKEDIIAFMKTLSDTTFFNNPEYQSPF